MENQQEKALIDLVVIIPRLVKRWYVFVFFLSIFFAASRLYLKYQTPFYKVNSILRVGSDRNTGADALLDEISPFGAVRYDVLDEITIMKSYSLAQHTINNLDLNIDYFVAGDIKKTQLYKNAPFKVYLDSGMNVMDGVTFTIAPINVQQYRLTLIGNDFSIRDVRSNAFVSKCVNDLNGVHRYGEIVNLTDSAGFHVDLVDMSWVQKESVTYNFIMKTNASIFNEFIDIKVVSGGKKSSIMHLSLVHPIPALAVDYINALMESYCNRDYQDKLRSLTKSLVFLRKQILETQSKLSGREIIAQNLKEDTKIYDLDAAADNTYQQILVLQEEVEALRLQENYYGLVITYIKDHRAFSDLVAPSLMGIDDPMVASIVENLKEIYVDKARKEFSAQENNPSISTLNLAQQKTIDIALENLDHGVKRIEFNLKSIEQQMEEKFTLLKSLPSAELNFLRVKREIDGLNNLLTFLVEREAALGISAAKVSSNHQVVDYARLSSFLPISPKRSLISVAFVILGLIFSLVVVYFLEFFNSKVATFKELETVVNNKVLATIPLVKNPDDIDVFQNPKSFFAESLRVLKHRLDFALPEGQDGEARVIALTSAISGEGKTFLSAKLASSLAIGDHKVMLIGADLRKPKLSMYFKEIKDKGLSEYLVGKVSKEEIISKLINTNLDYLLGGEIPPNPAVLLANNRFKQLLLDLKRQYDYIIIDCPPVGLISDYHALNVNIDLTVFVVKQDYSFSSSLKDIEGYNLVNSELVFNGVKEGLLSKYSSNYRYDQGYYQED